MGTGDGGWGGLVRGVYMAALDFFVWFASETFGCSALSLRVWP